MKKTLLTLGIGAAAMYLFDPELGEIRRSLLKDKLSGRLPKTADAFSAKADELVAKVDKVASKADEAAADAISNASLPSVSASDEESDAEAHSKHG